MHWLTSSQWHPADSVYAEGVVTLKTGRTVAGQIILQCPGYLTVCFKIDTSEPGTSELVPYEEVRSVMLEEALSDVDPLRTQLRQDEEITIAAPGP